MLLLLGRTFDLKDYLLEFKGLNLLFDDFPFSKAKFLQADD